MGAARAEAKLAVALRVLKFGGSSLATAAQLHTVARYVKTLRDQGDKLVIVVSAMGRTTEALLAQAQRMCKKPPPRELDMLVSCGERAAMALLTIALANKEIAAISLTGSQSGIITDEAHQSARIVAIKPDRIKKNLKSGNVVVCAGYQGVSRQREVTTLLRGGSDITAVALAAALGAKSVEILSDVQGVFDADPHIIKNAKIFGHLHYSHVKKIGLFGARILHHEAVRFAQRHDITIVATRAPSFVDPRPKKLIDVTSNKTSTFVDRYTAEFDGPRAIAWDKAASLLEGFGPQTASTSLFVALKQAKSLGASLLAMSPRCVFLSRRQMLCASSAPIKNIADACGLKHRCVYAVSILGEGLLDADIVAEVRSLLSRANIVIKALFASDGSIQVAVAQHQGLRAQRALYKLVNSKMPVP